MFAYAEEMGEMKCAIAREDEQRTRDRFTSTLVIAAAIIAAVKLARLTDSSRSSPQIVAAIADSREPSAPDSCSCDRLMTVQGVSAATVLKGHTAGKGSAPERTTLFLLPRTPPAKRWTLPFTLQSHYNSATFYQPTAHLPSR